MVVVFDLHDMAEPIQPVELVRVLRRRYLRRRLSIAAHDHGWVSHHPEILEIKDRARRAGRELTEREQREVARIASVVSRARQRKI